MSDQELDTWLRDELEARATVTPAHRQRAWQAIQERAAQQTILPPVAAREALPQRAENIWRRLFAVLTAVFFEEGRYLRAEHNYYAYRYGLQPNRVPYMPPDLMRTFGLTAINTVC